MGVRGQLVTRGRLATSLVCQSSERMQRRWVRVGFEVGRPLGASVTWTLECENARGLSSQPSLNSLHTHYSSNVWRHGPRRCEVRQAPLRSAFSSTYNRVHIQYVSCNTHL